ncbi:hypothetical protein QEZ48_15585 [Aquamicrobium lusatiense]|uniref:hypothetical protein n=1 Tax=Aquamicrobium lusatiense TaxID=89772 RepID=UPI002456F2DA|nr:hypothetical protein [Aquamicrobium lusatiense]MDH4992239.1 hypothetical protein [Aquamicrobium lusatiense]
MTAARQNKPVSGSSKPFTFRLSDSERFTLERRAGGMPLGAYVKCVLFNDGDKQEHRGPRAPVQDRAAMASLLARMGASRTAEWLAMLAHAAESGSIAVDAKTTAKLHQACHDVLVIRLLLVQALGFQVGDSEVSVTLDNDHEVA